MTGPSRHHTRSIQTLIGGIKPKFLKSNEGNQSMKKLISCILLVIVALSFSACSSLKKDSPLKIKCPSCGYEFDIKQRSDPGNP